jgi:hypothetical protein
MTEELSNERPTETDQHRMRRLVQARTTYRSLDDQIRWERLRQTSLGGEMADMGIIDPHSLGHPRRFKFLPGWCTIAVLALVVLVTIAVHLGLI